MLVVKVHPNCAIINGRTQAALIARTTGCKGDHPLSRLPSFRPTQQIVPDAMHTVKNVMERIVKLITGQPSTSLEVMLHAEEVIGHNYERRPTLGKRKKEPLHLTFVMTKEEKELADVRCTNILTPAHVDLVPKPLLIKRPHLKSHDWKQVSVVFVHLE